MYIYSIYVYIGELVSGYIYTHTQDIAGIFSRELFSPPYLAAEFDFALLLVLLLLVLLINSVKSGLWLCLYVLLDFTTESTTPNKA